MMSKKTLTARQEEIFDLLASGNTPAQVAKKAKPKISQNAVYMTIRRIEAKGHTVPTPAPTGAKRGRKPGPKPKVAPSEPVLNGGELLDRIAAHRKEDIKAIELATKTNLAERERLANQIEKLLLEFKQLEQAKEQLTK
jgi:hypothetical protein